MHTIYLIINGSLGMSSGKIAAQTFQACQRLMSASEGAAPQQQAALRAWINNGTKTIVKIAPTEHLFQRACEELAGMGMKDEGKNEVAPGSTTIWASWPICETEPTPRILTHKRIPMFRHESQSKPDAMALSGV